MSGNIKGPKLPTSDLIVGPKVPKNENIVFSFSYYCADHQGCNAETRDSKYFHALLERLKNISLFTSKQFRTMQASRNPKAVRIHRIHWSHPRIIQKGFRIPNRQDLDDEAWQFSIDQHQNGRVHGFLIDTVFHVVWLDPDHALYPW